MDASPRQLFGTMKALVVAPTTASLFCYGTLMAPEVMRTLLGRAVPGRSAHLVPSTRGGGGYRRHPVRGRAYPGLIVHAAMAAPPVRGVLFDDLSDADMRRLDRFEGVEYVKEACTVQVLRHSGGDGDDLDDESNATSTTSTSICNNAIVYLWANPVTELDVTSEWSYENFREQHLADYLIRSVQPCRDEADRAWSE